MRSKPHKKFEKEGILDHKIDGEKFSVNSFRYQCFKVFDFENFVTGAVINDILIFIVCGLTLSNEVTHILIPI